MAADEPKTDFEAEDTESINDLAQEFLDLWQRNLSLFAESQRTINPADMMDANAVFKALQNMMSHSGNVPERDSDD